MFYTLLLSHILVAFISIVYLGYFSIMILKNKNTKNQARWLATSGIGTTFSGATLIIAGASISRTCVALGAYSALLLAAIYFGNKNNQKSDCPYLNGSL